MKNILKNKMTLLILILSIASLSLIGCASKEIESSESITLKVGATPLPHAEILEIVKPLLADQGITLEIVEFTDYVTPNISLNDGEIDANFFQHQPYLDTFNSDHNYNLVSAGTVHLEPLGLYSEKISNLSELTDGANIAIPNDATNEGRALILLENKGLIKLSEGSGLEATEIDIVENPLNLKFTPIDAAQLPRTLIDVDAAVINTNYALEAGLNPTSDALIIEGSDSPYANIVTVRPESLNDESVQKLMEALHSDAVKTFIEEQYMGAVVPAF